MSVLDISESGVLDIEAVASDIEEDLGTMDISTNASIMDIING